MKQSLSLVVVAALLFTGCGPLLPRAAVAPPGATQADRITVLRDAARKIPLGKRVNVRMVSGEKVSGKLRAVGEVSVSVTTSARTHDSFANPLPNPEPAKTFEVPYSSMQSIQRQASVGSWIWLVGGGFMMVMGIILAADPNIN